MAKFYGTVGYSTGTTEVKPGIHKEAIVERSYMGDITRNTRMLREDDTINPDLSTSNSISILADAYANEHFFAIRYVSWAGTLWTVREVEVESPRLVLRLGGVYNGPRPETP